MRRLAGLLLLLAACGADLPAMESPRTILEETKQFRARLEIQRLAAELEQRHALRREWPQDWRFARRACLDPWGSEYLFEIDGETAVVYSAGPDGEPDTADDVHGE